MSNLQRRVGNDLEPHRHQLEEITERVGEKAGASHPGYQSGPWLRLTVTITTTIGCSILSVTT
jgi:hypothetical protein